MRRHRRFGGLGFFHSAHRHGGFGPGGRFFGPGEVRIALLSLLADGPKHGYELMKALEERSGGTYRASAGTVYPTLQQLADEARVASEDVDGKRVFRLTAAGRQELADEDDTVRRIWARADEWGDWRHAASPDAWELVRPARHLVKAAFRTAARCEGDPRLLARLRRILDRATREIEELRADD